MVTLTEEKKKEILGRKPILADVIGIYAKVNYTKGIEVFDSLLGNKSQGDFKAKIHLIKHPKGIEIKLAKLFKSYSHAISFNKIMAITFQNPNQPLLSIKCHDTDDIVFGFSTDDFSDILVHFKKNYKLRIDFGIENKEYNVFKKKFKFIEESKESTLFKGRISRSEFAWSYFMLVIINIVALVSLSQDDWGLIFIVSTVIGFINASLIFQRLHDLGRPGHHYLLTLIPIYNIIFILFDLCGKEGQLGKNKYGDDPRKTK